MTSEDAPKRHSMSFDGRPRGLVNTHQKYDLQPDLDAIGARDHIPDQAFKAATLDRSVTPPCVYSSQIATRPISLNMPSAAGCAPDR
jgi:hypothetical protein